MLRWGHRLLRESVETIDDFASEAAAERPVKGQMRSG